MMSDVRSDPTGSAPRRPDGLLVIGGSSVAFDGSTACLSGFFKDYGERLTQLAGRVDWLLPLHKYDARGRFPLHQPELYVRGYAKTEPFRFWRFLRVFYRHRRALIFATQGVPFLPLILLFHYLFGMKFYIYAANNFSLEVDNYKTRGCHIRALLWDYATKILLKRANGVIARGRFLFVECQRYNRNCTITLPLGNMHYMHCEPATVDAKWASGRLVFLGRLQPGKGIDVLLQAFAELRAAADTRAVVRRLTIIGSGATEAENRALAHRLGIADVVEFAGYIGEPAAIVERLRDAALLVMPSKTYPEGVPRAIEEALTLEVPVVATAIGGVPSEFDDGSVTIVAPDDVAALRDGIRRVLATRGHYERAVAAVARRRLGICWQSPAEQHFAFVTAAAAERAPTGCAEATATRREVADSRRAETSADRSA